jgi:DNA-binding response OmpR family regulator
MNTALRRRSVIVVSMKGRILVVEDDPRTAASMALYLRHEGFEVMTAPDGDAALAEVGRAVPDLVVLDLMLPGVPGLDVCRAVRDCGNVPIIMVTARATEDDKLRGLGAGADDYITKPFSPRELVARVHAVLRRTRGPRLVRVNGVDIDLDARTIRVRGRSVNVTATEFRLLDVLASAPGRTFSRTELAERVFGYQRDAQERTLDAHVMNLRRKIEPERGKASVVVTVFGVGYRLGRDDD